MRLTLRAIVGFYQSTDRVLQLGRAIPPVQVRRLNLPSAPSCRRLEEAAAQSMFLRPQRDFVHTPIAAERTLTARRQNRGAPLRSHLETLHCERENPCQSRRYEIRGTDNRRVS